MMRLSDLHNALKEKYNLSQDEAESFILSFIEVLKNGLQTDKQVKIKGLGTFKLIPISARESIDVNTGERIVIEGRDKISFTPESSLKNRVNQPFELFEAVPLTNGVDFSEIDKKYDNYTDSSFDDNTDNSIVSHESLPNGMEPNQVDVAAPIDELEEKEDIAPLITSTIQEDRSSSTVSAPQLSGSLERDDKPISEVILSTPPAQMPLMSQRMMSDTERNINDESMNTELDELRMELNDLQKMRKTLADENLQLRENLNTTKRNQRILIGVLSILLLAFIGAAAYINHQFSQRNQRIDQLFELLSADQKDSKSQEMQKNQVDEGTMIAHNTGAQTATETQTIPQHQSSSNATQSSLVTDQKELSAKKSSEPATKIHETNAVNEEKQTKYNADPRVRTGAYIITGIAHTVKIQSGQTLITISKAYLGAGMECYVEAVNDNFENLKVGDELKIPALKLKKRSK